MSQDLIKLEDIVGGTQLATKTEVGTKETVGVAQTLIDNLKDSVPFLGNSLQKLYNLILLRVSGPSESVDARIPVFSGIDGKVLIDSGKTLNDLVTSVISEVPAGLIDGNNTIFTLANSPISAATVLVFVNGISRKDFSIVDKVITLGFAPTVGSLVQTTYFKMYQVITPSISDVTGLVTALAGKANEQAITIAQNSTGGINVDWSNDIIVHTLDFGSIGGVVLTMITSPTYSDEVLLIVKNARAVAATLTLPTAGYVLNGLTYSFLSMMGTSISIAAGKSAEVHLQSVRIGSNVEIRMAGGPE